MKLLRRSFIGGMIASALAFVIPSFGKTTRTIERAAIPRIALIGSNTAPGTYQNGAFVFRLLEREEVLPRHSHPVEHPTFCLSGEIEVVLDNGFGNEVGHRMKAGDMLMVPAKWDHTIIPIGGKARFVCVMAFRDADGKVVDNIEKSVGF